MTAILPMSSAPVDPGSSAILARLLTDAFEALNDDIDLVRVSLSRAVALLNDSPVCAGTGGGGLAPWQGRRISDLIEDNLKGGVRISELAASARLSKSHFSRAFKTHFGRSPQQYILERRVARAQRLMLVSDSRLCEIAIACGFSDQAHLSRMFRRTVGDSPNAWRRCAQLSHNLS
jgi:AraC family transcriptional regulator